MKTARFAALAWVLSLTAGQTSSGVAPCDTSASSSSTLVIVEDTAGAIRLAEAVNCSGGSFDVTWVGSVTVEEAIHVRKGTTLSVAGSADGTSVADGAGQTSLFIVDEVGGVLNLSDLALANGNAEAGGALLVVDATITLDGCTFSDNNAAAFGGAVLLAGSELTATDVSFVGNSAQITGGALYADSSGITLKGLVSFVNNEAGGFFSSFDPVGGGVYLSDSDVAVEGSVEFVANSASKGGAAYLYDGTVVFGGPLLLANNSASSEGGGIWAQGSDITVADNARWEGNHADVLGGGIIAYASTMSTSSEAAFIENTAGERCMPYIKKNLCGLFIAYVPSP